MLIGHIEDLQLKIGAIDVQDRVELLPHKMLSSWTRTSHEMLHDSEELVETSNGVRLKQHILIILDPFQDIREQLVLLIEQSVDKLLLVSQTLHTPDWISDRLEVH